MFDFLKKIYTKHTQIHNVSDCQIVQDVVFITYSCEIQLEVFWYTILFFIYFFLKSAIKFYDKSSHIQVKKDQFQHNLKY